MYVTQVTLLTKRAQKILRAEIVLKDGKVGRLELG